MGLFSGDSDEEVTRREFLKKVGATSAAVMTAPSTIQREDIRVTEDLRESEIYEEETEGMSTKNQIEHLHEEHTISWKETKGESRDLRFHGKTEEVQKFGKDYVLQNEQCIAIVFAVENRSKTPYMAQISATIPVGWAMYGSLNISSASACTGTAFFKLPPREEKEIVIFTYRSGESPERKIEMFSTYYPENHPEKGSRTHKELKI